MKKHLFSLLTALRFLTIIPLPWFSDSDSDHFIGSVKYFAIVGLLIGILVSLLCKVLQLFVPHLVLCAIALFFLAIISGFLHLDGLADTADGFFSARPKEKILEIMHDSRTGAMGVILLFFVLLFKFVALASLSGQNIIIALFFMPFAGRCAIVLTMSFLPYAREGGGLGKLFYAEKGWLLPVLTLFFFFLAGSFVDLYLTALVFITVVITVVLFAAWCTRVIGGTTGDTLGAVCEITETSVAVALACFLIN